MKKCIVKLKHDTGSFACLWLDNMVTEHSSKYFSLRGLRSFLSESQHVKNWKLLKLIVCTY